MIGILIPSERLSGLVIAGADGRTYTQSEANFIFFDSGRPHDGVTQSMKERGVQVARAFPPYSNWIRITIGIPAENGRAEGALRQVLKRVAI